MRNLYNSIRKFLLNLNLQKKILVSLIVLSLIPLLVISSLIYNKSKVMIQEKTGEYTLDILNETGKNIEYHLMEVNRLYYSIFTSRDARIALRRSNRGFEDNLEKVIVTKDAEAFLAESIIDRDDIDSVYLISNAGDVFRSGYYSHSLNRHYADLRKQLEGNRGNLEWLNPDPGSDIIPAGSAVYDVETQEKIGYFIVFLRERSIWDVYRDIKLQENGSVLIINRQGQVISGHRNPAIDLDDPPDYAQIAAQEGNGFFSQHIDGQQKYIAYATIWQAGWKMVSVIPTLQYEREVVALRNWAIVISIICFVLALLLSYFIASSITKPIRHLARIMRNVEREQFKTYSPYQSDNEIGLLSRSFNSMIGRIQYLIERVYQEQLLKQRSELNYLKFQINPHFLFNTLETINWMARMNGLPEVGKVSKTLGDLMRKGIKGKDMIPMFEELENIEKYMLIQKYRYGDKFNLQVQIDPDVMTVILPKFILQPIVENAIVHGLELKKGNGCIRIYGQRVGDFLYIEIQDDGVGMGAEKLKQLRLNMLHEQEQFSGIGLSNVHQRIQLYYGKRYGLKIESTPGEGTTVRLELPSGNSPAAYGDNR